MAKSALDKGEYVVVLDYYGVDKYGDENQGGVYHVYSSYKDENDDYRCRSRIDTHRWIGKDALIYRLKDAGYKQVKNKKGHWEKVTKSLPREYSKDLGIM